MICHLRFVGRSSKSLLNPQLFLTLNHNPPIYNMFFMVKTEHFQVLSTNHSSTSKMPWGLLVSLAGSRAPAPAFGSALHRQDGMLGNPAGTVAGAAAWTAEAGATGQCFFSRHWFAGKFVLRLETHALKTGKLGNLFGNHLETGNHFVISIFRIKSGFSSMLKHLVYMCSHQFMFFFLPFWFVHFCSWPSWTGHLICLAPQ